MQRAPRLSLLIPVLCAIAPGAGAAPVSGSWSGDFLGHESIVTLVERDDGSLIGFLPGDPNARITGGAVDGNDVTLELSVEDPMLSTAGTFEGSVTGNLLDGDIGFGGPPTGLTLMRDNRPYTVEYWLMGEEEIDSLARRVLDATGDFATGGFVGIDTCDFLSCAGDFTDWEVAGDAHTITATAAGCVLDATLDGTFDDTEKVLVGTYDGSDCEGDLDGDFIGGKSGRAASRNLFGVLVLLAEFADRVQAESFTALDLISDSYLNDGKTKAHWESDLSELFDQYQDLSVRVARIDTIATSNDAQVNPMVELPPRVEWRLVVDGEPEGGGAVVNVADETFTLEGEQQLFWIAKEQGIYRFVGNGFAEPFAIDLPIESLADNANDVYGLWPFGVHGGGHPEGHPGWDFEYTAGASVVAAADGIVVEIEPNDSDATQTDVQIEHRPGITSNYHHLTNLPPGIVVGANVAAGDVLGDPGSFPPGFLAAHFDLRVFTNRVCPSDFLSAAGQILFDAIWADAAYGEELTEPFPCQTLDAAFPLTRVWERTGGSLPEKIELSRASAGTLTYDYVLRNAADAVIETGEAEIDLDTTPASIDLDPDGGGATHLGVYRIVSGEMMIDWDDVARPADLSGASSYETD